MERRGIETLHIVERHGGIDHESKPPSANHIPERDRDKEVDRPLVTFERGRGAGGPPALPDADSGFDGAVELVARLHVERFIESVDVRHRAVRAKA